MLFFRISFFIFALMSITSVKLFAKQGISEIDFCQSLLNSLAQTEKHKGYMPEFNRLNQQTSANIQILKAEFKGIEDPIVGYKKLKLIDEIVKIRLINSRSYYLGWEHALTTTRQLYIKALTLQQFDYAERVSKVYDRTQRGMIQFLNSEIEDLVYLQHQLPREASEGAHLGPQITFLQMKLLHHVDENQAN